MLDLKPIDGSGITPSGTGGCVTAWQATGVYRPPPFFLEW